MEATFSPFKTKLPNSLFGVLNKTKGHVVYSYMYQNYVYALYATQKKTLQILASLASTSWN